MWYRQWAAIDWRTQQFRVQIAMNLKWLCSFLQYTPEVSHLYCDQTSLNVNDYVEHWAPIKWMDQCHKCATRDDRKHNELVISDKKNVDYYHGLSIWVWWKPVWPFQNHVCDHLSIKFGHFQLGHHQKGALNAIHSSFYLAIRTWTFPWILMVFHIFFKVILGHGYLWTQFEMVFLLFSENDRKLWGKRNIFHRKNIVFIFDSFFL